METSGKDLEVQRRLMVLTQRVKKLEAENIVLRQRLTDVSQIKGTVCFGGDPQILRFKSHESLFLTLFDVLGTG